MRIFNYDEKGLFVGESIAEESPLEPGIFLIPAQATSKAPPEVSPGQQAICNGDTWTIENIPPEPIIEKPAELTAAELRRMEITARLSAIDADSARPSREIIGALAAGLAAPAFALAKVAALETEAGALRAELKASQ